MAEDMDNYMKDVCGLVIVIRGGPRKEMGSDLMKLRLDCLLGGCVH